MTTISHGDYEGAFNVLVDDLNERGGINDRKVQAVFAPINPIGTQPADEACLKLTEDDQVFAITGFFLGDAVLCPLENHDTAVIGGEMNPERLERATAPWFTLEASSDLQADGVRALRREGAPRGQAGGVRAEHRCRPHGEHHRAPARRARDQAGLHRGARRSA